MFFFAPVLLVTLPTPGPAVSFATTSELEAAGNVGVRGAHTDGGYLAADPDSWGTILTVVDGDVAARHIAEIDANDGEGGTYRVEYAAAGEGSGVLHFASRAHFTCE